MIAFSAPETPPSGPTGGITRVVSSRCCCAAASRSASSQGIPRFSAIGTKSVSARYVRSLCTNVFSQNHFGELTEAHVGLFTRALPCEPHLALGPTRCAHVQEPCAQNSHTAVGARTVYSRRPRDVLRQVAGAPPQARRPRARGRLGARLFRVDHPCAGPCELAYAFDEAPLCDRPTARPVA